MKFEQAPIAPPNEKPKEEKQEKPRFAGTEAGFIAVENVDKLNNIIGKLNEKEINSVLSPILYPKLKEAYDLAFESLADAEDWYKDKPDKYESIASREKEHEMTSKKLEDYDKLRSTIMLGKELSQDQISMLVSFVGMGQGILKQSVYEIKDELSEEYKKNREQNFKLFAAEIYLKRKLRKTESKK